MKALILTILILVSTTLYAESIKIGWIGPLTGNAAALGVDGATAAEMTFEKVNKAGGINGKQIEFIIEDDQYVTAKTVKAYNKLVHQQGVKILYVVTYGGLFAIADKAQKDGVLLIDPLDCDDPIAGLPNNTLCVSKKTEGLADLNAIHAVEHKNIPPGIIYYEGDPFMGILADATIKKFKELGVEAALSEGYTDDQSDFKPILLKAKSRGVKSLFFYGYDSLGSALKQARDLGLDVQFYAVNTISSPGFLSAAGDAVNGTVLSSWLAPRTERFAAFIKEFKARKGREPFLEIATMPSIDIANLIVEALKKSEGDVSATQVRDHFYATKNYQGISGPITMDSDGITRSLKNNMFIFENGGIKALK